MSEQKESMRERVERDYTYIEPHGDQIERYDQMRRAAKLLAMHIIALTPASREQSLALTSLEEAMFWSNAAIARHG